MAGHYWIRFEFGPRATLASDPVVGTVTRFVARVEVLAANRSGSVLTVAGLAATAGMGTALWQWRRGRFATRAEQGGSGASDS